MTFMATGGTFENESVLTELIAEFEDFEFECHRQFLTDGSASVHPVVMVSDSCMN
jgi:hypothetical protein